VYEKYEEEFLTSGRATELDTYRTLFGKLEDYGVFIGDWENENLDEFMQILGSSSVNSVNKYLNFIREFYRFVCGKEGIELKDIKLSKDLKSYIDLDALLSITINESHYKMLRDLLLISAGYNTYNYRDACLLVLAWTGCSNEEIKYLNKNNVEFFAEYNIPKCKLWLSKRILVLDDAEDIEIIKQTINESRYFMNESGNKSEHFIDLKSSPALIRGVSTRESNFDYVSNPGEILSRVLNRIGVLSGTNIDLNQLTLESISRSRKISLFMQGANIDDVKNLFTKETSSDLYWLSQISNLIQRRLKQAQNKNL